jgi:DNA repair protein RadC
MQTLLTSQKASEMLRQLFDQQVEEVRVIALGSDKSVINHACIFRGTSDACLFHPRDVFRFVILNCASGFILAHNHPFTSANPSDDDILVTQKILKSSRFMGIELVDHIIIGKNDYFSFADKQLLRVRFNRVSS